MRTSDYISRFGEKLETIERMFPDIGPKEVVKLGFEQLLKEEAAAFVLSSEEVEEKDFDESGAPIAYETLDKGRLADGGYVEERVKIIRDARKALAGFLEHYRSWCSPEPPAIDDRSRGVLFVEGKTIPFHGSTPPVVSPSQRERQQRETTRLSAFKLALASLDAIEEEHRRHKTVVRDKDGHRRAEPWITDACIYLWNRDFTARDIANALNDVANNGQLPRWLLNPPGKKGVAVIEKRLQRARAARGTANEHTRKPTKRPKRPAESKNR
jgi:hypothetical protein